MKHAAARRDARLTTSVNNSTVLGRRCSCMRHTYRRARSMRFVTPRPAVRREHAMCHRGFIRRSFHCRCNMHSSLHNNVQETDACCQACFLLPSTRMKYLLYATLPPLQRQPSDNQYSSAVESSRVVNVFLTRNAVASVVF